MDYTEGKFDAVVIGAGHAGCEAALALARTGLYTAMLTLNLDSIAFMACNPSIGGTAKGHLVREIDALGGEMAINADKTSMQMRMLNRGKGVAVQSLRGQADKNAYHREMKRTLENTPNLRILQGEAVEILTENGRVTGVKTAFGSVLEAKAVIVATGVYLNGSVIAGEWKRASGPSGFAPANDPQVIVLLAYDRPKPASPGSNLTANDIYISGGNMAAPKAGPLIAKILDYMGVEKEYTAEESAAVDVSTPRLTGKSLADAQSALSKSNLGFRTIGSGDTVTSQIPAAGAPVPGGSTVILYLGDAVPQEKGVVPDVTGLNYEAARNRLESAGFFMRASGVSTYYGNTTTAESQSVSGGEEAAIGTVVNVGFFNVMEDGSVGVW